MNIEKVTNLLNIQKEIDNFSFFFFFKKEMIMKQINKNKSQKKFSPEQSALKGFPTNTMTKNPIFMT